MVLPAVAAVAIVLPFTWLGCFFFTRWQNQYPTGMAPYPMGDKARDPKANREAVEADLAAGQRQVRVMWRLWPYFALMLLVGIGLTMYNLLA